MTRRPAPKRLSINIPSLTVPVAPPPKPSQRKMMRLSFSEEFHETVRTLALRVALPTGQTITLDTTTGETVKNITKVLEERHGLEKGRVILTHNGDLLLPCLSLADVPGLVGDEAPLVTATLEDD